MKTVNFIGEDIEVCETPLSKYASENDLTLEDAIQSYMDVDNFEILERELCSLLERMPTEEEVAACQSVG